MDCRNFEQNQIAFIDGTLADALLVEMQLHLSECERCARRDTALRRGLMVLRSLPEIEPSSDFSRRLEERLNRIDEPAASPRFRLRAPGGLSAFAAAALAVVAAGYLSVAVMGLREGGGEPMLAPVIASAPEVQPPSFDHVFVMPAAAGLPMWSSAMMLEQAPVHFMTAEMRLANWGW